MYPNRNIAIACRFFATLATIALSSLLAVATADGSVGDCPNQATVGTGAHIFDCRGYELVSPAYKEGFPVQITGISEDGSRVLAQSPGTFSAPEGTTPFGQEYEIARGASGWETAALAAPSSEFSSYAVEDVSPDFQSSLWLAVSPRFNVAGLYVGPPEGTLARMGPAEPGSGTVRSPAIVGDTRDLRHVLFSMPTPFVSGELSSLWPGDTTMSGRSLYEYEYPTDNKGNSEPRLVGVNNVGVPESIANGRLISNCGTYLGSLPEGNEYNAVSATGSEVFFTAAACGGAGPPVNEVYARSGGEKTVAVSSPTHPLSQGSGGGPDECDATCEGAEHEPGLFEGASEDGLKVFFITSQPLLNGDRDTEPDLYEAEIVGVGVNAKLGRLVQISRDPNIGQAADVQSVARVSEDGSHVYFYAGGVLTGANGEGEVPVVGQRNLYVHSQGCPAGEVECKAPVERTSFVATVPDGASAQVTPDGRFLVFTSATDLTPDEEGHPEAGQVFEYDAQTERLIRVSRSEDGYNEDGNSSIYPATIPVQNYQLSEPIHRYTHLAVSADGSRVFFTSRDALTTQAINGAMNVYEYHNSQVGLISDGHDLTSTLGGPVVELIGTDESGLDVFFATADRLTWQDTDDQVDVYDARVGGGFAQSANAPCLGDSCQDAAGGAPALLPAVTSTVPAEVFPAVVRPTVPPKKTKKTKTTKRKAKKRKATHTRRKRAHGAVHRQRGTETNRRA